MKKFVLLCSLSFAVLLLAGCRTAYTIDGRSCYPLNDSEISKLVETARNVLLTQSAFVKEQDKALIEKQEPNVIIDYTDDRTGIAKISWDLPTRVLRITFRGEFLTDSMRYLADRYEKPAEDKIYFQTNEPERTPRGRRPPRTMPLPGAAQ